MNFFIFILTIATLRLRQLYKKTLGTYNFGSFLSSDFFLTMKVTVATLSDTVFTLDVSDDLEIENFKVSFVVRNSLLRRRPHVGGSGYGSPHFCVSGSGYCYK